MRRKTLNVSRLIVLLVFISIGSMMTVKVQGATFNKELLCEVQNKYSIEAIIVRDAAPNEIVFTTTDIFERPSARVWKMTLDPNTGDLISVLEKRDMYPNWSTEYALFECLDGTLFVGSGWYWGGGHNPFYSTDGGENWHHANLGSITNSYATLGFAEFKGNIYACTGYGAKYGRVHRWLGNGSWTEVFQIQSRTIARTLMVYGNELFVGLQIYGGSGYQNSRPVYVSSDGSNFNGTDGIPVNYDVHDLFVVNGELIAWGNSSSDGTERYVYRWNGTSWDQLGPRTFDAERFYLMAVTDGSAIYDYGRLPGDSSKGVYRSMDMGLTWEQVVEIGPPDVCSLHVHDNIIYMGTYSDSSNKVYIYRACSPLPPTVTTTSVSSITATSASGGGDVTSDGGAAVTARGVCWRTFPNPTISDSHTTDGTGTGTFTSSITGLIHNTTYYVRAYATNSAGTAYGKQKTFTTPNVLVTISGTVTDGTSPIEGVTITFSHDGHTETTDANGNYSYTVAYGTSTTVTASKPGYIFEPTGYSYTNLAEDKPDQDFTALNYVSVIITNPQDSGTVSGEVIINAEVSSQDASAASAYASIQSVTKVEFYIDGVLVKQDTRAPYQHRWDTTLVSNGSYAIKAKAFHSSGLTNQHEITVNVNNSTEPPHIRINRTRLNYGAVIGESRTGSQTFLISNSGGCCLDWTVQVSDTWIEASPLSGTANMLVTVSVDVTGLSAGSYTGTVAIIDANADNSPGSVDIYLEVIEKVQELPLFGSFDSPTHGTDVCSVVPFTGWALDDIEVSGVKIFRNPVPGHETGIIYIGDAVFMEGARPDVEERYPGYPKHYQAGWAYQMLTNYLPDEGNGTFVITAVATDSSGNEVTLGSKTIICDNANAVKPFGAIDTPFQGGDASGTDFINFGWALTPLPNTIPTDGSTIKVWVDGVPLAGNPVYNLYRKDIAAFFPGYNNSDGAAGYYYLDTTLYANGIHTISWSVTDDAGNTDGIGSRYFRIMNVENPAAASTAALGYQGNLSIQDLPISGAPVYLDKGYITGIERKHHRQTKILYPDNEQTINIVIKEDERIEIGLKDNNGITWSREQGAGTTNRWAGFHLIGDETKPFPIGSFLDVINGIFYWQPGPGFIGQYRLVFVEKGQNGEFEKKMVNIVIEPKF